MSSAPGATWPARLELMVLQGRGSLTQFLNLEGEEIQWLRESNLERYWECNLFSCGQHGIDWQQIRVNSSKKIAHTASLTCGTFSLHGIDVVISRRRNKQKIIISCIKEYFFMTYSSFAFGAVISVWCLFTLYIQVGTELEKRINERDSMVLSRHRKPVQTVYVFL